MERALGARAVRAPARLPRRPPPPAGSEARSREWPGGTERADESLALIICPPFSFLQPRPVKIFVGGLASTTAAPTLRAYAARFGVLADHVLMENRGFGFVTFVDPAAATRFLEVRVGACAASGSPPRPPVARLYPLAPRHGGSLQTAACPVDAVGGGRSPDSAGRAYERCTLRARRASSDGRRRKLFRVGRVPCSAFCAPPAAPRRRGGAIGRCSRIWRGRANRPVAFLGEKKAE